MENKLRMCVPCHFGLESVLAYEIKKIGGENLTTTDGKISFEGGFDVLAKANLWIATGERVLIELGSFRAESFEQLLQEAFTEAQNGPVLIDVPIDYKDNISLGETILPDEFY